MGGSRCVDIKSRGTEVLLEVLSPSSPEIYVAFPGI